ncbi:MAG: SprT family zinc-dependent metalloprotease, partial [Bacteroidales bacterium]|nr:SprT family zinc-dependent metalloprotease [Bacteroidales bacterium]
YPPDGKVKVAAPLRMDLDTIRVFVIDKLQWIKTQQVSFKAQDREAPRKYVSRENHYYQGKRYMLKIIEHNAKPKVVLTHSNLELYIRPNTPTEKREEIIEEWYREQLKATIPKMAEKWEKIMGVKASEVRVRKMKTKWGSCNTDTKRIWINLELAKKPLDCLEYIIVHEFVHLLERSHNEQFVKYMDKFMPKWRFHRDELNRLPFRHLEWGY